LLFCGCWYVCFSGISRTPVAVAERDGTACGAVDGTRGGAH